MSRARTLVVMFCVGFLSGNIGCGMLTDCGGDGCLTPEIMSIEPARAAVGQDVVIAGRGFGAAPGAVNFAPGVAARPSSWSDTRIVTAVPDGSETGNLTVRSGCGTTSAGKYFAIETARRGSIEVYVSATTGRDSSGDGSVERPWNTIQRAAAETSQIAGPESPVSIRVEAGTYRGNVILTAHQSLMGGYAAGFSARGVGDRRSPETATTLDGGGAGRVVEVRNTWREPPTAVISGFTIQNGGEGGITCNSAAVAVSDNTITANRGPGIEACDGRISNNEITGNSAESGGGLRGCRGDIIGNTISYNYSSQHGGGIDNCDGTIQDNTIIHNEAVTYGGGLFGCDGKILHNEILDNAAYKGAGLSDCNAAISDNTIKRNIAKWLGGGLADSRGTISHNRIMDNSAGYQGGGLYACGMDIMNNTISGNKADDGAGIARAHGQVISNTISNNEAGNRGGGLYYTDAMLDGNTISGNRSGGDGGGIYRPLNRVDGGSITGNHAVGLGGGVAYELGVTITSTISGNTCERRPTIIDCYTLLWELIQEINDTYVIGLPWFICLKPPT
jgi:hypothetical protein